MILAKLDRGRKEDVLRRSVTPEPQIEQGRRGIEELTVEDFDNLIVFLV